MKKLCIYHGNCADGFGSAWVVRKALGEDVEFHAGVYQNPPPVVHGRDVVMVDFSYKRPVLEQMRDEASSVLILDHHQTAEADLRDLGGVRAVFDMNRSGARITWDHYFPNEKPPQLLLHIEDRDLWRFALHRTREIQANVFSHPYDFNVWDELMKTDQQKLAEEGAAIERKHFKDIAELVGVVTRDMRIGGYLVPIANLPYTLTSDAGHLLAKGRPFAGCYWDTPQGRVFSLRSTDEGLDVAEIAKQYGGGGTNTPAGSGFHTRTPGSLKSKPRPVKLAILLLLPSLAFGLLGCATGGDDFVRAPYLEQVSLRVKWHDTEAHVRAACAEGRWLGQGRQSEACTRVYVADGFSIATLYLVRPTRFDGPEACRAGHELYHALGGEHP